MENAYLPIAFRWSANVIGEVTSRGRRPQQYRLSRDSASHKPRCTASAIVLALTFSTISGSGSRLWRGKLSRASIRGFAIAVTDFQQLDKYRQQTNAACSVTGGPSCVGADMGAVTEWKMANYREVSIIIGKSPTFII